MFSFVVYVSAYTLANVFKIIVTLLKTTHRTNFNQLLLIIVNKINASHSSIKTHHKGAAILNHIACIPLKYARACNTSKNMLKHVTPPTPRTRSRPSDISESGSVHTLIHTCKGIGTQCVNHVSTIFLPFKRCWLSLTAYIGVDCLGILKSCGICN